MQAALGIVFLHNLIQISSECLAITSRITSPGTQMETRGSRVLIDAKDCPRLPVLA